jgi:hypothetical protein
MGEGKEEGERWRGGREGREKRREGERWREKGKG